MFVDVSSAEVFRLLEELPARRRARAKLEAAEKLARFQSCLEQGAPLGSALTLLLGPCVFLRDDLCSIYEARPGACRAWTVWHESSRCAEAGWEGCVPAELILARRMMFFGDLEAEAELGRAPFHGEMRVVLWALGRHGTRYRRGADLRGELNWPWVSAGLLRFYGTPGDRASISAALAEERTATIRLGRREPWPFGMPRGEDARDRSELHAFRVEG